jgi:hypothetical protein
MLVEEPLHRQHRAGLQEHCGGLLHQGRRLGVDLQRPGRTAGVVAGADVPERHPAQVGVAAPSTVGMPGNSAL